MRREGGSFAHFSWTELMHYDTGADYAPLQFDQRARQSIEAVPEGPVDRNIEWIQWDHSQFEGSADLLGPSPSTEKLMRAVSAADESGVGLTWMADLLRRIGWGADNVCARI
eukprot:COSAG02_NODE_15613_length_1156_cov_0.930937_2_plen_112_part_00